VALALSDADSVRARIAAAWLDARGAALRVGEFELRPEQREALNAALRSIEHHGGALIVDPPGTGKTVIALAAAAALGESPMVVAPAAVRAQWLHAAAVAGVAVRFVSFEALGRGAVDGRTRLVIIDEAHHARTPTTRRYARLAELCASASVLLLSATPVVNRPADRDALLALFLGARAATLEASLLSEIVIRRGGDAVKPTVRRLPDLHGASEIPGLARALTELPPPFPAADGREATTLISLSLAMAWRSSLAALDTALRRRLRRGAVIRDELRAGRWPDRATLRLWIVADDAIQLALPFDSPRAAPELGTRALATVAAHLDAVRALIEMIASAIAPDTAARAAALLSLSEAHADRRIVCFAQHAATIRALWSALRGTAGVVAITGERVSAAAGRWTRAEVLRALGPRGEELRSGDARAIRLLLTSDLLAEGVELQGVGIVVHGDAAWTPARLEQRVGRAARVGNRAREIFVTGFRSPPSVGPLLRLATRLAHKRSARTTALEPAVAEAQIAHALQRWTGEPQTESRTGFVHGTQRCLLAVLEHVASGRRSLVGGRWRRNAFALSTDPSRVLEVVSHAGGDDGAPDPVLEAAAFAALKRWELSQRARAAVGDLATADSAIWRRIRSRLDQALASTPWVERAEVSRRWSRATTILNSSPGVGTRRQLAALDRGIIDHAAFAEALIRLASERGANAQAATGLESASIDERQRLLALLIVTPTRAPDPCGPPTACSETAATR